MRITPWYHVSEKLPDNSGWYIAFKDTSIGDDYTDIKPYYFDVYKQKFFEYTNGRSAENVKVWCDMIVDFEEFPITDQPSTKLAADSALKAIDNFNLLSDLSS